ncbi:hypothetical protein ACQ4PT_033806 [Festuca glaucescens]
MPSSLPPRAAADLSPPMPSGLSRLAEDPPRQRSPRRRFLRGHPSQSRRDRVVRSVVQMLAGPCPLRQLYAAVPEAEARRAAAAIEAEAHAAVSESASGATLASDVERFEFFNTYCKEFCLRSHRFLKSRAAALGAVRKPGESSAAAALALAASASEE